MRAAILLLPFLHLPAAAALQDRRPLTVEDGDAWRSLRAESLSWTGAWVLWELRVADGSDGVLRVASTEDERRFTVERGTDGRFDAGERVAVCRVLPPEEEVDAWKEAKEEDPKEAGEEPRPGLAVIDLEGGSRHDIERVRSFALGEEGGDWLLVHLHEPEEEEEEEEEEAPEEEEPEETAEEEDDEEAGDEDREPGTELLLRSLVDGAERRLPHVTAYRLSKDGRFLAFVTVTEEGEGDGVHRLDLRSGGDPVALRTCEDEFRSLAFAEDGDQLAFLGGARDADADEDEDEKEKGKDDDAPRTWTLYHARADDLAARALVTTGTPGLPEGWGVSGHRDPAFSESGGRLLLGTAPLPEPEPEEVPEEDRVTLDVWSWTDDRIQPRQLVQLESDRERSFLAVVHLAGEAPRLVQLASPEIPDVRIGGEGDAPQAVGISDLPYRHRRQWDPDLPRDLHRIDVATGRTTLLVEAAMGTPRPSPTGRWVRWWDGRARQWMGLELARGGEPFALTEDLPHPLWNELNDRPRLPRPYGTGGWLTGDVGLLVYDEHDVWLVDPTGEAPVVCVTEGVGRREGWRFRRVDLDREEPAVSPMEPLLLSAFHLKDKRGGFFRDRLIGGGEPTELLVDHKRFGTPVKAREGDVLRLTRQDFVEYPDLWVADTDLEGLRRLSEANPQQEEFLWGEARLHEWRSRDGTPLQGILLVPEGFDPSREYPLVVYFYERMSDRLHSHSAPVPSRSSIRFPYYTSNGYCVFVPDIPYRIGYPGASACDAVLPGVLSLIDDGFVDPGAIGVQGHSWGGYQIAYMVTQTDLFAAAVAGAPVSNMTSAYGGIRWSSGLSRQFQYEKTQSRLGGSLWEVPLRYLENSPLFYADRVETPILMLHNDEDGAVPWYQGIEYFVALRRLGRPAWLLNYNGEGHGLGKYAHRRDYARRMSQFFDHYLRDAPPPRWLAEGIPALRKGRDLGLEPVEPVEGE